MDLSGLRAILSGHPIVEGIAHKVETGASPSAKDTGHFEDEEVKAHLEPARRRDVLRSLIGVVAAGSLGGDTYVASKQAENNDASPPNSYGVSPDFLRHQISKEYTDRIFNAPISLKGATVDETALHNSNHYLRLRKYADLRVRWERVIP
jgi:hypothetical protein